MPTTGDPAPVPFTRPALPPLAELVPMLEAIWERQWVTNAGPVQQEFESALSRQLTLPPAVMVASGSAALRAMCRAAGVEGEVVVSGFTHAATGQALLAAGVVPVPADIRADDLTVDVDAAAAAVTGRTSGLLITHTFGHPADLPALERLAAARGLTLLFDAAAAVGVRYRGRSVADYGTASAFSFHATKLLCSIEGGAVCGPDLPLLERVRELRNFGMPPADPDAPADPFGMNGKSNELLCAVGLLALDRLPSEVRGRARAVARYRDGLAGVPGLRFVEPRAGTEVNHGYCAVRLRTAQGRPMAARVDGVLHRAGVESRRYFAGRYALAAPPGRAPEAGAAREDVLCLPLWGAMGTETVERVCELVRAAMA